jgi:hypothetical protein
VIRRRMGDFFGHDFSSVKVHTDRRVADLARSLHARAFTVGERIAFAQGSYRPAAPEGARLLAHELSHVVQQAHGLTGDVARAGVGAPGDRYEREAEHNADRWERGQSTAVLDGARSVLARPPRSVVLDRDAALQLYSGSTAAAYARRWALGANPAYPPLHQRLHQLHLPSGARRWLEHGGRWVPGSQARRRLVVQGIEEVLVAARAAPATRGQVRTTSTSSRAPVAGGRSLGAWRTWTSAMCCRWRSAARMSTTR